jgi:ATP-binding cassette subfamily F protein uup
MEGAIEKAEAAAERVRQELEDPAIATDAARLGELYARLEEAQAKIAALYDRWDELEALRARLESAG